MEKYPVIHPDGQIRWLHLPEDLTCSERLHAWYDAICCSTVEVVHTMIPGLSFLVDECGKCYDQPLPVNIPASMLYAGTQYGDPIVGYAILCSIGDRDGEPDILPPSAFHLAAFSAYTGYEIP